MKRRTFIIFLAVLMIVSGIVVAKLLFTGPRMKDHPSLRAFETRVNLPPDESVMYNHEDFDVSALSLPKFTDENMKKGETYYGYYCVFCHGADGRGEVPVGQSFAPAPADLTNDSLQNYTIQELYAYSFTGVGHSPVMERVVPYDFRKYILAYVKGKLSAD